MEGSDLKLIAFIGSKASCEEDQVVCKCQVKALKLG
jgi:hypothetical protein